MNKLKKLMMVVLAAMILSFGATGCKKKGEHPHSEHPDQNAPAGEHPTDGNKPAEHPK